MRPSTRTNDARRCPCLDGARLAVTLHTIGTLKRALKQRSLCVSNCHQRHALACCLVQDAGIHDIPTARTVCVAGVRKKCNILELLRRDWRDRNFLHILITPVTEVRTDTNRQLGTVPYCVQGARCGESRSPVYPQARMSPGARRSPRAWAYGIAGALSREARLVVLVNVLRVTELEQYRGV